MSIFHWVLERTLGEELVLSICLCGGRSLWPHEMMFCFSLECVRMQKPCLQTSCSRACSVSGVGASVGEALPPCFPWRQGTGSDHYGMGVPTVSLCPHVPPWKDSGQGCCSETQSRI